MKRFMLASGILSLLGLLAFACDSAKRDDSGVIVGAGDVEVESVRVGDCFQDWDGALNGEIVQLTTLSAVPCGEPHDNEIFHSFDLSDDGGFPGDASLESIAVDRCLRPFEAFVGIGYYDSRLDYGWMIPSLDSWREGDREVVCFLFDLEFQPLVGSMRGVHI